LAGASLDDKFLQKVKSIASQAEVTCKGLTNEGQVSWDTLADGGPDDPGAERFLTDFHDEFDRKKLGADYTRIYSDGTSDYSSGVKTRVSEIELTRMQYDWLMQVERDFLLRRRPRIRTEAHAAAVREMNSINDGPVLNGILRVARQIMAKAGEEES